ncbi:MAG: DnaJ domain-containing protein [Chloroflexota bacterium]
MTTTANHYELLGLPPDAIPEEIRRAYFEAARKLHPDVNPAPDAADKFIRIQKAYEVLSDPPMREAYDQKLSADRLDPVTTNLVYSRSSLSVLSEQQLIYVLLEYTAAKHLAAMPPPPINLCLVLDRSTSMQGVRLDTVKTAAVELLRQLKPEDQVSVVAFSDRAEVLIPAGKRMERLVMENQVHMLRAGGGTEIFQGLEAGFDEINRFANRMLINHMVLITDGRTYGDEDQCLRLAEKAGKQGIRITGLGIGTEWNDTFLDELTTRTGGTSHYISRTNDIRRFLQDRFESLNKVFAERVALDLKLAPDVRLNSVFRLQPEPGMLPIESPIRLGSVLKEGKLSVLLEMVVPEVTAGPLRWPIATAELNLVLPSDPYKSHRVSTFLSRLITPEMNNELPPREIFQALSQITLYRMQERARQEIAEGKIQDASMRLQRLATQLLSMGEVELAQTAIIEAERIQQTHMLSAEGEKQIKYGTRSFLLPAQSQESGVV